MRAKINYSFIFTNVQIPNIPAQILYHQSTEIFAIGGRNLSCNITSHTHHKLLKNFSFNIYSRIRFFSCHFQRRMKWICVCELCIFFTSISIQKPCLRLVFGSAKIKLLLIFSNKITQILKECAGTALIPDFHSGMVFTKC